MHDHPPTIWAVPTAVETLLLPALTQHALLVLNHVLASEPSATERLRPHVGRVLRLEWQLPAGPWPRPPAVALRITPAGLFESLESAEPAADAATALRVSVELPTPPRALGMWLAGERPALTIDGDVRLAADVAWLAEHLRWDVEHDLARLVGDAPAHQLARLAAALRDGLRATARQAGAARGRPGGGATASR